MNFRNFCLFLFPLAALPSLALCTLEHLHSVALPEKKAPAHKVPKIHPQKV
jgi:hypothetical protein